jgi:hypothetical protein
MNPMDLRRKFMRRGPPLHPQRTPGNISVASEDSCPPRECFPNGSRSQFLLQETCLQVLKILFPQGYEFPMDTRSQFIRQGPPFHSPPPGDESLMNARCQFMLRMATFLQFL